jgi:hypothetical protein
MLLTNRGETVGRQIQFFWVNEDEQQFINKVIESGDSFLDTKGNKLETSCIRTYTGNIWIVSPQSKLVFSGDFIDHDEVEAIQFRRCCIIEPQPRLTEQDIEKQKEARLKHVQFLNKVIPGVNVTHYSPKIEEDKLNYYRSQKRVDIGRLWIQTTYYSSYDKNAKIIYKAEWILKRYEMYKRWMIKNSKTSKDTGFKVYIGKETYKLYKEEGWKMMQLPITEFDF